MSQGKSFLSTPFHHEQREQQNLTPFSLSGPYQLPRRSLPPGFGPSPQFPQGYPGAQPSQFNPQQQQQLPNPIQQQPQRHAGLGAPGAAANLPPPPNLAQGSSSYGSNPQFVGEKWTLFVGSVADGVDAGWLERILNVRELGDAVFPLHEWSTHN